MKGSDFLKFKKYELRVRILSFAKNILGTITGIAFQYRYGISMCKTIVELTT